MITEYTIPVVFIFFAVQSVIHYLAKSWQPRYAYLATNLIIVTPMYARTLMHRVYYCQPLLSLEVEATVAFLSLFLVYKHGHDNCTDVVKYTYMGLIAHLLFTPVSEDHILHRIIYVMSMCFNIQYVIDGICEGISSPPLIANRLVKLLTFFTVACAVAVDVWGGNPTYFHYLLLFGLPHLLSIDVHSQSDTPFMLANRSSNTKKNDTLLLDFEVVPVVTNIPVTYDYDGFIKTSVEEVI